MKQKKMKINMKNMKVMKIKWNMIMKNGIFLVFQYQANV